MVGRAENKSEVHGVNIFILVLIVVSSAINGAKFAMLEGLYSCFVAMAIFYKKPKFNIIYAACIFLLALVFAMFVLSSNLEKKGLDVDAAPSYMPGGDVLTERLVLRILSNADKYYLTLPGVCLISCRRMICGSDLLLLWWVQRG